MADRISATVSGRGCVVHVDVPEDFGLDSVSYGGPGRVYHIEVTRYEAGQLSLGGDLYKFKKDGSVGKASSPLVYGAFTWENLPAEIVAAVREAYAEWVASIPKELP